jgi:hypothetical protein
VQAILGHHWGSVVWGVTISLLGGEPPIGSGKSLGFTEITEGRTKINHKGVRLTLKMLQVSVLAQSLDPRLTYCAVQKN